MRNGEIYKLLNYKLFRTETESLRECICSCIKEYKDLNNLWLDIFDQMFEMEILYVYLKRLLDCTYRYAIHNL